MRNDELDSASHPEKSAERRPSAERLAAAKTGSAEELVPEFRRKLEKGEPFWLTVTGISMNVTLKNRVDSVLVCPLPAGGKKKLRNGDVPLIYVEGRGCLLHRVVRIDGDSIYTRGDAFDSIEGPIPFSAVVGVAREVMDADGKRHGMNSLRMRALYCLSRMIVHRATKKQ